ncbi:MAG: hypothetical protein Q7T36_10800 [Fluviicoccus sp.]|uniref:hypothetical protein n=1 Tax=Fluviicoccus sp. TaxID=2003552 RepID=UPI002722ED7E|nr:hypothetical protein [Fluviicoccus sp.]MDO8330944.1 hypothetical protein [Fluviicoccus sp.]
MLCALLPGIAFSLFWLVAKQGEALALREHRRGFKSLLGRKGFISTVLARVPEYFARDFHPSQQETRQLELQWRERLFGRQGELNDYFRNRSAVQKAAGVAAFLMMPAGVPMPPRPRPARTLAQLSSRAGS